MTVDDTSSQDSTLIDEDLVEALGFEPVTTVVSGDDHLAGDEQATVTDQASTNGHVSGEAVDLSTEEPMLDLDDVEVLDGDVAVDGADPDVDSELADLGDGDVQDMADELLDDKRESASLLDDDEVEFFDDEAELDATSDTADTDATATAEADLDVADADVTDVDVAEGSPVAGWEDESIVLLNDPATDGATDLAADIDLDAGPGTDLDTDLDTDLETAGETDAVIDVSDAVDLELAPEATAAVDLVGDEPESLVTTDAPVETPDPYADYEMSPPAATPDSVFADVPVAPPTLVETAAVPATAGAAAATAAVPARVRRKKRLRARKSRRVIRHIDPWSVLTFSVLFHMFLFAALLLASVLVWNAAIASGMIENVESFIQELGDYETFEINADVMFKAAIVAAGMLTLASSVLVVLLTVVFNLISDLIGGIRVTVIEEETVRVPVKKQNKNGVAGPPPSR